MDRTYARHRRHVLRPAHFVETMPDRASEVEGGRLTFTRAPLSGLTVATAVAQLGGKATSYTDGAHPAVRSGSDVYVTEAAAWFGQSLVDQASSEQLARCWAWLDLQLKLHWRDDHVGMLATPGTTGRDLWLRTVPQRGWPLLATDQQDWLREVAGQARTEVFTNSVATIPELVEYDMRLAYVAVTRALPCGRPEAITAHAATALVNGVAPELRQPGRWQVEFRPPAGWDLPGILPVPTVARWTWPTSHEWHGPTWVDGCELWQALQHGWQVRVAGPAWLWAESCDPYRTFVDRLMRVITLGEKVCSPLGGRLVRAAVRSLLLHTIGAMHGNGHGVSWQGTAAELPAGARSVRNVLGEPGQLHAVVMQPTRWPETSHPEWTTHLWARARARLMSGPGGTGLLHLPEGVRPVAIRTDAVYLTGQVGWPMECTGRPGAWVKKRHRTDGPLPWPRNRAELLAMRDG